MIQLHGNPVSTCTRKVLTALLETNTPYHLHVIDFTKGEHKQRPHTDRQPFGQVPAIEDEGFVLFESRAICRYISAKAGDQLIPKTLQERALMDQWSSVEQSNFSPHAMKFIYHYVFKRPQEPAVLEAAEAALEKAFAVLSKPLAAQSYLVGERFTIADIGFMPYLEHFANTPLRANLERYPHVSSWWGRLRERESWQKIIRPSSP